ncbi:DEAD/DEAH box helicase [Photobacterium alginatilyticum]|uniref:Diguanylate cyclase n=1 Tax=Photobacterium alginatilyticum TaxID=1775171 RepID=A0ABW9YKC7_9GAMM|nr:DEAD/DEAH box helicase family protein [Photobacterium alginatilyticum]NBI54210.1 diguanylate cyclase [Photobacterium alginatilyticum]
MKLRAWQTNCVNTAFEKYLAGHQHFMCLATPGAGKTIMASQVAKRLLLQGHIDFVLCFSPSAVVAQGIRETFASQLGCNFEGGIGDTGASYTYQGMLYRKDSFWQLLKRHKVLVVFDEIHHCAGSCELDANSWGAKILTEIQGYAAYTLALTGTPWRSDSAPIVLASYTDDDGQVLCDYSYGLADAITDGVCRVPKIVLVDNDKLQITRDGETESFSSFNELLKSKSASYLSIITQYDAMKYVLQKGCETLAKLRKSNSNPGGLVVAASVSHANMLLKILVNELGQTAEIVTYHERNPLVKIEQFKQANIQWIVSVGMISEGTDIPRLQVCCHLSTVKTELYFRQVLGRILRKTSTPNQEAWLYTLAEERLSIYAERVEQNIPEAFSNPNNSAFGEAELSIQTGSQPVTNHEEIDLSLGAVSNDSICGFGHIEDDPSFPRLLLGDFRERLISAFM